jgi:RNA polymerase sigma factor (sigma-70 family)
MSVKETRGAARPLGSMTGLGDGELLECFAARVDERDETADLAFRTLLERHAPMVMRICCSVVGDRHDAEDAFQATFLVLARRARSIRRSLSVASWLFGTALRVAANARSKAIRKRRHEQRLAASITHSSARQSDNAMIDDERDRILHDEIGRLPQRFRTAVVLCYLEGLTHEQAALQLVCPVATIRSRLATARERLRRRLPRRGLSRGEPMSVSESSAPILPIPAALVEATIRGALQAGFGKAALAGVVSAEVIALSQNALTTIAARKLTAVLMTTVLAGIPAAALGYGLVYAARKARAPAIFPARDSTLKPQTQPMPSDVDEFVQSVIREGEAARKSYREINTAATSPQAYRESETQLSRQLASDAGMLLNEAERHPRTPAAEVALLWIACNIPQGSMFERAIELIVRDHIQSDQLKPLFDTRVAFDTDSKATEQFLREALAQNPDQEIKGLACLSLALYLDWKADRILTRSLFDPAHPTRDSGASQPAGGAQREAARHAEQTAQAIEREAASLYHRTIREFAELTAPKRFWILMAGGRRDVPSVTLEEVARTHLFEIERLELGRPAPEIEGLDVDGKPMKLSDYRGKVIAIFFGGPLPPSPDHRDRQRTFIRLIQATAERHAADPFVLLGVSTISPGPSAGREAYQMAIQATGMRVRFWWDFNPDGTPGPIQTAWNADRGDLRLFVLDHQSVMRYKDCVLPEQLEHAIALLVAEQRGHAEKGENAEKGISPIQ